MDIVKHKLFGEGKVVNKNGNYITVKFQDGSEKQFVIPKSFEIGVLVAEGKLKLDIEDAIQMNRIRVEKNNVEIVNKIEPNYREYKISDGNCKEQILQMKNKDFVYQCLNILIEKGREKDVEKLTDPVYCKRKFDMNFSILQEVPRCGAILQADFFDHAHNRRYYPEPIIAFDKRYIVCNDWYYNTRTNKRDTRGEFVDWILN